MEKFTVSPWKVVGEVDYNKLIEYFGTKPITKEILEKFQIFFPCQFRTNFP